MSDGGRAVRAGCGAFGLVGLLLGVGLTVWLGAKVMDSEGTTRHREPAATTATVLEVPRLSVAAAPAADLVDGQRVVVTGKDLTAGAAVDVRQCLGGRSTGLVVTDGSTCDEDRVVHAVVGTDGRLRVEVPVARLLDLDLVPFDCATDAGFCALVASTADGARSASFPLTFAPAPPPELTLPH